MVVFKVAILLALRWETWPYGPNTELDRHYIVPVGHNAVTLLSTGRLTQLGLGPQLLCIHPGPLHINTQFVGKTCRPEFMEGTDCKTGSAKHSRAVSGLVGISLRPHHILRLTASKTVSLQ